MTKTKVCSGIILALVLLYSNPAFAEESLGAQGMLSARELRAVGKSGGTVTSQSNVLNGGMQVRYGGDEKSRSAPITNASTINQLNTKGYSSGPGGTVILSGTAVNSVVSRAMSSSHGSMDRAVNALQSTSNAIAQKLNLPVTNQRTSAGGVNVPAVGGAFVAEDKAAKMDAWAAQLGLNMADQNSHVNGRTAQGPVVSGRGSTSNTYTMNPLDGTEAGDILGIEPGSTRRVVVPQNTVTNANSLKSGNVSPGTTFATGANQSANSLFNNKPWDQKLSFSN